MNQSIPLKRIISTLPIAIVLLLVHRTAFAFPQGNTFFGKGTGAFTEGGATDASFNSGFGFRALARDLFNSNNTAIGAHALEELGGGSTARKRSGGQRNTAIGSGALQQLGGSGDRGNDNIAVGYKAGHNLKSNNGNIDIGNEGVLGDAGTIRIGDSNQTKAFIAGISGVAISGAGVFVDASGQLGVEASSARFKDEIKPMNNASEAILALKPVVFRYKNEIDPTKTAQFGLVAEDVAKVNPDLVTRDRDGKPFTVRYEAVNAMLLNEFLKEHRKNVEQETTIARLEKQVQALTAGLQKVRAQLELNKSAPQTVLNDQ